MPKGKPLSYYWNKLKADFGNKCAHCGSARRLEFAHLKPTKLNGMGRGKWQRYCDIKKNPDCYRLLCKPCHKAYDDC